MGDAIFLTTATHRKRDTGTVTWSRRWRGGVRGDLVRGVRGDLESRLRGRSRRGARAGGGGVSALLRRLGGDLRCLFRGGLSCGVAWCSVRWRRWGEVCVPTSLYFGVSVWTTTERILTTLGGGSGVTGMALTRATWAALGTPGV
uniref:Uncharacterized protein n=1 Tax=Cacopsylla melanoneura TaxID=428564 RepID=A0A8D9FAW0_9HEMI